MEENREDKMVITVTNEGVGFDIAGTGGDIMKNFAKLFPAIYKTAMQMGGTEHSDCENCEDSEGCEDIKPKKTGVNRADTVIAMGLSFLMQDIHKDSYFANQGERKIHELLMGFVVEEILGTKQAG
jgi:hypothetical protein